VEDILHRCARLSIVIMTLFICAAVPVKLQAQTTGSFATISGVVLDPEGKVVPGASLTIKNDLTGVVRSESTTAEGRFAVPSLPVGTYTIEVTAPGFATARSVGLQLAANGLENISIALSVAGVSEEVTVSEFMPLAATLAPSQSSLDARSAESVISPEYIENFTSPNADYTEVVQMAPGTFSLAPNGQGLGDSKIWFRGFKDGQYNITFDGIPFYDTNDPTHHSWAFFPGQFIGQTVFDRSPGSASTVGPESFGGSINMMSHALRPDQNIRVNFSYGSFNTRLYEAAYNSGNFGPGGKHNFWVDIHQMKSDGYQTYNTQRRNAGTFKYQFTVSPKLVFTAFTSIVELKSHTPDIKGATRAQIAQFGDNYLLSNDPAQPNYYKYNFYHIPSDFDYVGATMDLGHGWAIDTKVYTLRYYNKQNFDDNPISTTSAIDKLNSYRKWGYLLPITQTSRYGILHAGMWLDRANTYRFQTPSDPRNWYDAPLPNFKERFITLTTQPYVEYELKATRRLTITPGVRMSRYGMDFTQYADNGKTVGNLNGAPFIQHSSTFHAWQPNFDVNYKLRNNWSGYFQFATGNVIPPTSVFDVKNAAVAVLPKPTQTKTYQFGSVWKTHRLTLDVDVFHINFDNTYSSFQDPGSGEPVYFLSGTSTTNGVEAESTIFLGAGLSAYVNATGTSAKYDATKKWIAQAPRDTEAIGLSYQHQNWDLGFFNKRIGHMWNDNGSNNQAVSIDPFEISNLYLNYTIKSLSSEFSQTKLKLTINNLFDHHNILAVVPALKTSNAPNPNDVLTLMAARSVSVSMQFGFSPKH